MTVDRLFFPVLLAAGAALTLLAMAEPARVATAHAQAGPVVQLERVVITAQRLEAPRQLARTDAVAVDAPVVR